MNHFSTLGLSDEICEVLHSLGFEKPTPIQEKAIPLILNSKTKDFIGLAHTGTGKTAAFGLPLVELIDNKVSDTQALILAPTRELGQQTAKQIKLFAKSKSGLNAEVVYGGANIQAQIKSLKNGTQIIIATPGRLLDLMRRKAVDLSQVKYLVLDEADEMLNMGFKEDIDAILAKTGKDRRTWLFSATMPGEIRSIVKKYMTDPDEVKIGEGKSGNVDISHKYIITKSANKIDALRRFLDIEPDMRGVMFCRTKRETQEISDKLSNFDYNVEALHGDLSQAQRNAVMKRFKGKSMQLLVATDVAARGIDVEDLSHVIHHSLPEQLEVYTHRSGRTGRAGNKGISLVFINSREQGRLNQLEKKLSIKFDKIEVPGREELIKTRISHWSELILNLKEHEKAEDLANLVEDKFKNLSKEDLIRKLITTQLDHIGNHAEEDLNEKEVVSNTNSNEARYFINIGSIDGITKGDLLHLLSDTTGIKRSLFGEIELKRNCSFFYLNKKKANSISQKFQGMEIEGRTIRVNIDEEGPKSSSESSKKGRNRNKGRSGRNKKRRNYSKSRY